MFEWDKEKEKANLAKHRLAFSNILPCFSGPMLVVVDARFDYGEQRFIGMGAVEGFAVVVVYTKRGENIRIISARKAGKHEREKFKTFVAQRSR